MPKNHIKNFPVPIKERVFLTGTVCEEPNHKASVTNIKILLKNICKENACTKVTGKILVIVNNAQIKKNISFSDIVLLRAKLSKPYSFYEDAGFNYREFLTREDIYFISRINNDQDIRILGKNAGFRAVKIINDISKSLNELLFKYLPSLNATFYSAIILGVRGSDYINLSDIFVKTGTAHILAISGLHVGIVVFIFLSFLKAIRVRRKLRFVICIFALVFYCLLTGMRPSVMRASIMAIFILIGFLIEREASIYNSLSLAALLILIFQPRFLFDIGFQLSFISVLGIVFLTPCFTNSFMLDIKTSTRSSRILKFLVYTFFVSAAAWLATVPLIMYYFKIITPIAILANIIIVPTLTIIVGLGFALLLVANFAPLLAIIIAKCTAMVSAMLIHIVSLLSRIPLAYFYVNFKLRPSGIIMYYILLIVLGYCLQQRTKHKYALAEHSD